MVYVDLGLRFPAARYQRAASSSLCKDERWRWASCYIRQSHQVVCAWLLEFPGFRHRRRQYSRVGVCPTRSTPQSKSLAGAKDATTNVDTIT